MYNKYCRTIAMKHVFLISTTHTGTHRCTYICVCVHIYMAIMWKWKNRFYDCEH